MLKLVNNLLLSRSGSDSLRVQVSLFVLCTFYFVFSIVLKLFIPFDIKRAYKGYIFITQPSYATPSLKGRKHRKQGSSLKAKVKRALVKLGED